MKNVVWQRYYMIVPKKCLWKKCRKFAGREHFEDLSERDLENGEILRFCRLRFCEESFGIQDEEVLEAIRYHTVGKGGNVFSRKRLYILQIRLSIRNYPSVDKIRKENL